MALAGQPMDKVYFSKRVKEKGEKTTKAKDALDHDTTSDEDDQYIWITILSLDCLGMLS